MTIKTVFKVNISATSVYNFADFLTLPFG